MTELERKCRDLAIAYLRTRGCNIPTIAAEFDMSHRAVQQALARVQEGCYEIRWVGHDRTA